MKRFFFYLVFIPIAVVVLLFAVANREVVTLSLDPFSHDQPAMAFDAPLFIILFVVLGLGVVVGGVAAWLSQGRNRRELRQARAEAERSRAETEALRTELAGARAGSRPALPAPVPF
jgi:uncharacterized integral membrane protein